MAIKLGENAGRFGVLLLRNIVLYVAMYMSNKIVNRPAILIKFAYKYPKFANLCRTTWQLKAMYLYNI